MNDRLAAPIRPAAETTARPVVVVVLTWNGLEHTKRCLASLRRIGTPSRAGILVVDNGSTDGTVEYLRGLDDVTTILNGENLGFVRGNNVALRQLPPDTDAILLNNDTEIDDPAWIDKLQATAYADDRNAVVGCRIRRLGSRTLQHAGTYMPDVTFWGQQIAGGERDIGQYAFDREVEGVVFACVYLRRTALARVGLLDEEYFSYFEDTDYCLKVREAGLRVMVCGGLTIGHREHGSTSANNVSQRDMFLAAQQVFVRKWRPMLDRRLDVPLNLHSTFSRPIGYAISARLMAKALEDGGVRVAYRYLYGPGTPFPVPERPESVPPDYRINIIRTRTQVPGAVDLVYGQGDAFRRVGDGRSVGYTMLETTGVPADWVERCNAMDEVWVPSPFNAWTFRRSGVTADIAVMPLGLVDPAYFGETIEGDRLPGTFTFLSSFEWGERKAPETLLRAFNRAFRRDEPVVLLCKYSNSDPGVNPAAAIDALGLDPAGGRIVLSENEQVPDYQLGALYRSADCFVLATRGEGWGMPILEAMACGLPVIASHWSAQQLFMTDANSYPLQVDLVPAVAKCPYYDGFQWAEPSTEHLARLMRHVYEHRDEAQAKGRRAAQDVRAHWTLESTGARLRERIVELSRDTPRGAPRRDASAAAPAPIRYPRRTWRRRIGVDVSRAVGGQVTGVGRYAAGLLAGLSRLAETEDPFEWMLLPGFAAFTHPQYAPTADWPLRPVPTATIYRGPLPAFGDADRHVPGLDLVHCTAHAFPSTLDGAATMVVHDMTFESHPQWHTAENVAQCRDAFARAVKAGAWFLAVSESSRRDFLARHDVDPSRVAVVHCGVDGDEFHRADDHVIAELRRRHDLPERFFLFLASREPRKNLVGALRAMAHVEADVPLVVAGAEGWLHGDLSREFQRAGSRARSIGYVDQRDLPALYSAATSLVYPSLYEGFGLPIVESMACGTPVVATRNSSMAEIATGAALLLDDPNDPREIARALDAIAGDARRYAEIAEAGLARAATYSAERCARDTIDAMRRWLGA